MLRKYVNSSLEFRIVQNRAINTYSDTLNTFIFITFLKCLHVFSPESASLGEHGFSPCRARDHEIAAGAEDHGRGMAVVGMLVQSM